MNIALSLPTQAQFDSMRARWRGQSLTYPDVGITRDAQAPRGYVVDHNRIKLGTGLAIFERAIAAMRRWAMFDIDWLTLLRRDAPIAVGEIVAIVPRHFGVLSISPCRIVYVIDEHDAQSARFGFGYGTLPNHVGRGEERFMVEWSRADDAVHYDIFATSQPGGVLTTLGYPVMRVMQKRFARASKQAMTRAVAA
jgi:uncharacterized protein (UPF0548 family)